MKALKWLYGTISTIAVLLVSVTLIYGVLILAYMAGWLCRRPAWGERVLEWMGGVFSAKEGR